MDELDEMTTLLVNCEARIGQLNEAFEAEHQANVDILTELEQAKGELKQAYIVEGRLRLENMDVTANRNANLVEENKRLSLLAESYRSLLLEWLQGTPTDKDGNYDPINQPQAYKARSALDGGET